jgi:hypothetical protein
MGISAAGILLNSGTNVTDDPSLTTLTTGLGRFNFTDVDLADTHTASPGAPTFTWSRGTLNATQQAALAAASTLQLVTNDSTGSGSGSVGWIYSITRSAVAFLTAGETLTAMARRA